MTSRRGFFGLVAGLVAWCVPAPRLRAGWLKGKVSKDQNWTNSVIGPVASLSATHDFHSRFKADGKLEWVGRMVADFKLLTVEATEGDALYAFAQLWKSRRASLPVQGKVDLMSLEIEERDSFAVPRVIRCVCDYRLVPGASA